MQLYAIRRRSVASPETLEAVDSRSNAELARRADEVRKIRSYLLAEPDGRLGSICIYEATGPQAIYDHGRAADVAVDEVVEITGIDVARPDPVAATIS